MIDVDHFKKYNDTYGHGAGDVILQKIGEILLQHAKRSNDAVYRIGGEEFLIICSAKQPENIQPFIDGIRASVEDLMLPHEKNPPSQVVTLSIGLVTFSGSKEPREVFEKADKLLYQSKNNGRNRITVATME